MCVFMTQGAREQSPFFSVVDLIGVVCPSDFSRFIFRLVQLAVVNYLEFFVVLFTITIYRLATYIRPPHVVKELSLVDNCWAEPADEDDEVGPAASGKPYVQKYCLMSMAGSYTDFHIDFGGSSVWYHILWVRKIFHIDSS